MISHRLAVRFAAAALLPLVAGIAQVAPAGGAPASTAQTDNPYRLSPFHADFPVELTYPNRSGREYDRTRRQVIEQLASNLQGNCSKPAWQMAMEFFWRAPADAFEPLVTAMDRNFGQAALQDAVRNCVEAMGKMADERFDAALQRALEHKSPQVRQAAMGALTRSGKVTTLLAMQRQFPQMDGRSRAAWLKAVALRLPEQRVAILRELMMADFHSVVRDQVLEVTLRLPPTDAAAILRGRWPEALDEFKAIIAGVLHAAGDSAGTAWLQDALDGQDLMTLQMALKHCARGELGVLRPDVLKHSTHLRADVRLVLATTLQTVPGDDVADVYEVMTAPEEALEVKEIALRELTRRGRPTAVGLLLEEASTATGTRLQMLLHLIAASSDPRAVPMLVERFQRAPAGEGRPFVQALALNRSTAAAEALLALFRGPVLLVAHGSQQAYTTLNYLPTLLLNVRGGEAAIVAAFAALPSEDLVRRAALLTTLAGLAGDRTDADVRAACIAPVRQILFDIEQPPQLRVLALNLLTPRSLTVDDALRLQRQRHSESAGMRTLFGDFLLEYF